jgi:acyl-coenzyme A thioesterase PaaI-like protein
MRLLGAELVEVGEGRCVIELPRSDDVTQHHGYFHAGAIGAMLDAAGGSPPPRPWAGRTTC